MNKYFLFAVFFRYDGLSPSFINILVVKWLLILNVLNLIFTTPYTSRLIWVMLLNFNFCYKQYGLTTFIIFRVRVTILEDFSRCSWTDDKNVIVRNRSTILRVTFSELRPSDGRFRTKIKQKRILALAIIRPDVCPVTVLAGLFTSTAINHYGSSYGGACTWWLLSKSIAYGFQLKNQRQWFFFFWHVAESYRKTASYIMRIYVFT